ncbi:hypothetical protein BDK51DRAFT_26945 [Blyttiomyces helicus]|uniref:Uncharacterized protein n=1 Tax=Blyttiomyces helicus TaxID=388810 RepID=A0A4P9WKM5_9FUNG|nr:hypothetical protein BDK51DRAFT_26945 [Blyttiomyces helicus]|eukprot:RKO92128.1 hypothetical protein BDK51DRAFT_26945 [Blyttiomyces helicus]
MLWYMQKAEEADLFAHEVLQGGACQGVLVEWVSRVAVNEASLEGEGPRCVVNVMGGVADGVDEDSGNRFRESASGTVLRFTVGDFHLPTCLTIRQVVLGQKVAEGVVIYGQAESDAKDLAVEPAKRVDDLMSQMGLSEWYGARERFEAATSGLDGRHSDRDSTRVQLDDVGAVFEANGVCGDIRVHCRDPVGELVHHYVGVQLEANISSSDMARSLFTPMEQRQQLAKDLDVSFGFEYGNIDLARGLGDNSGGEFVALSTPGGRKAFGPQEGGSHAASHCR